MTDDIEERMREDAELWRQSLGPEPDLGTLFRQPRDRRPILVLGAAAVALVVGLVVVPGQRTTSTVRVATPNPSSAFAPKTTNAPTATTVPVAAKPTPALTVTVPTSSTTSPQGAVACRSSQVRFSTAWQGVPGGMGMFLQLTNSSSTTCLLPGEPSVKLATSTKLLNVVQRPPPVASPTYPLSPGPSVAALVQWSNWCSVVLDQLTMTLSWSNGLLITRDVSGDGFQAPSCQDATQPSILSAELRVGL